MSHQRGNVLFLILIAVALFAALAYAVTKSSRGTGNSTKPEDLKLKASQMLQYGAALRTSVQRMALSGISPDMIELRQTATWETCTSATKFCVFSPKGGNVSPITIKADPNTDIWGNFFGYADVRDNNTVEGLGTSKPEIVLFRGITHNAQGKEICDEINRAMGISGTPVIDGSNYTVANFPGAKGQIGACLDHTLSNFYMFYYSLYEQ